ncbi:hypothetical protein CK203_044011 [Vitis vinifera]|uniref:Uncharacterized protein n=1 Tax=Vitis vinifera TaxID=29760 RepID=A0A438HTG5_VITVI|nr:hypothetical protein CK203_044011 [Vitis vinifera]
MEPYQEEASIGRPPFLTGDQQMLSSLSWNGIEVTMKLVRTMLEPCIPSFNAISTDEFRRIATCTSAKEAWDILQVTHEGTNAVKVSKLQMLTSRFETIRMEIMRTLESFMQN